MNDLGLNVKNNIKKNSFSIPVELVFLTMPYRKIEDLSWTRKSKGFSLSITSGVNGQTNQAYGLPFGSYSRQLLYHVCTEVIKSKKPVIRFGASYLKAMEKVGFNNQDGRTISRFKDHFLRLFSSRFELNYTKNDHGTIKQNKEYLNFSRGVSFWGKGDGLTLDLELSRDFYEYLIDSQVVPFDTDFIALLRASPVLMDIYIYLNYKAHTANYYKKDLFISYDEIYGNFGTVANKAQFKQNIKKHLKKLVSLHGRLEIEDTTKGFEDGILISKFSKSNVGKKEDRLVGVVMDDLFDSSTALILEQSNSTLKPSPPPPYKVSIIKERKQVTAEDFESNLKLIKQERQKTLEAIEKRIRFKNGEYTSSNGDLVESEKNQYFNETVNIVEDICLNNVKSNPSVENIKLYIENSLKSELEKYKAVITYINALPLVNKDFLTEILTHLFNTSEVYGKKVSIINSYSAILSKYPQKVIEEIFKEIVYTPPEKFPAVSFFVEKLNNHPVIKLANSTVLSDETWKKLIDKLNNKITTETDKLTSKPN